MIWNASYGEHRFGSISKRLAILILPAALLVGCGDSDSGTFVPTPTAPPATRTATATPTHTLTPTRPPTATPTTGNTSASAACAKLVSCTQCFLNQRGTCISTEDCAGRLTTDVARCINAVTGCDQQTLGTCLPFGCQGTGTGLCDMTGE
jgi:hypothetical protein